MSKLSKMMLPDYKEMSRPSNVETWDRVIANFTRLEKEQEPSKKVFICVESSQRHAQNQ